MILREEKRREGPAMRGIIRARQFFVGRERSSDLPAGFEIISPETRDA